MGVGNVLSRSRVPDSHGFRFIKVHCAELIFKDCDMITRSSGENFDEYNFLVYSFGAV